jgi:hypothetical protein
VTLEITHAVRELPGPLPPGERVLWQGGPAWRDVFRVVFHARALAVYFAILLALRGLNVLWDGDGLAAAAVAILWLLPAALFALAVLALVSALISRTTWYTITSQRVVMRIGVVLEVTFNFPFKVIDTAGLRMLHGGTGDISLRFMPGEQIAYAHLWPHARPWHFKRTEPMLRCVPDAARVAQLLARAIVDSSGGHSLPIDIRSEPRCDNRPKVSSDVGGLSPAAGAELVGVR